MEGIEGTKIDMSTTCVSMQAMETYASSRDGKEQIV